MANVPKAIQIHDAFDAQFRSAYLAEFGKHADAATVGEAFFHTIVPVLDKINSADLEKLSPGRTMLFVKTGVYQAILDLKALTATQEELQQAEDAALEALEMAEAAEETW